MCTVHYGLWCVGRNSMRSPRQKLRLWPHWFMALSKQSWTRKAALWVILTALQGMMCWTDYWWHVLILRILWLGSDGDNPNRGRRKLGVYVILQHGCTCILWSCLPGGWNNPSTVWQSDGSNWLEVGAQHCHIISNSHKMEFSYLTEYIAYIFQTRLLSFLVEEEPKKKKNLIILKQVAGQQRRGNHLALVLFCICTETQDSSCLGAAPMAGKEIHLHLKIQCTENRMTTSLISMPNDMHSNRQLCCFYNTSLFSFISAFLPPSFLKPFFELYFFLCLIWNLCSSVAKSFSLCLSSEPSLLYIRWEELIQLSPKLHFKSLQAWLHR